MSDIIQRTMASLPGLFSNVPMAGASAVQGPSRSFGVSNSMLMFIQNFSNIKSKYAEEQLVQRELSLQKQKLTSPSQTTAQKRESLVRLLYCHLLGYDVSFAYIHAVKLAQQGTILEKRVGYLACAAFLHDSHELSMLLINTIHRDLNSTNILEVCTALVAAGHLVSSELIPSLLPSVKEKLKHSKEIIRRKSVLCLRAFIMKVPDLSSQLKPCLNQALSDKDPGVMWAAVEAYHHLIQANAVAHVDLVPALVDILEQVISRKLPSQFDYHTVPAPWLTISIIRILALLGTTSESVGKQITPVLEDVLHRTEANRKAGLAIIYETLLTISTITADSSLMSLASKHVTRFLSAKQLNLRYIGIKILSAVVKVDDRYALDHQSAVLDCLEHEDVTIQKTTLHMLCNMANTVNKVVICDHLLNYANRTTDHFSKVDIITKVLDIIDRLSDNVKWYIDEATKILETNGEFAPQGTANKLIQVIKSGIPNDVTCVNKDRHRYALDVCWNKLKSEKLSDPLLQVAVWTVGEYCHLDAALVPDSVISCLLHWYRHCTSSQVRKWILSALCKRRDIIQRPSEALEILKTASNTNDKNLLQRLHELASLCTVSSEVKEMLSPQNLTPKMDFSLSFLDDFVSEALELGALPYRTASLRLCQPVPPKPAVVAEVPPSISDLFTASYETTGVPAVQPSLVSVLSSSLRSQGSSETSSTEQRDGISLKMKGVRVVWGKDGLLKQAADNREKKDLGPEMDSQFSTTPDDLLNVLKPVDSEVTHKEEERRNLASALFGGIRASPKELHQEQEKPAVKSVTEIDFLTENSLKEGTDEIKLSANNLSDRPDDRGTLENNFRKSLDHLAEIDFEASENHPTERSGDSPILADDAPDDHRIIDVLPGERSISPDSIESEGENVSSTQLLNPVSLPGSGSGCSVETPFFENLKVSSKTQSFTLPKSLHANTAEVSEKTNSNNSLVGQYLRSKAVASNSSVSSWHPSLSQSNNFGVPQQLFSSLEVQNSTGNDFSKLFAQQDSIDFSSSNCESTSHPENLPYLHLKTDSATSCESLEHSKKECSEFEVAVDSFTNNLKQNSEKGRTDAVGPIVNVYESEILSVVCQKYYGNIRSLQLLVTCCRQNLVDPVLFSDTSICVSNCSTVYQAKFVTGEGLVETVSLADLSGNSNYIEILLDVLPFNVQSVCQSDQLSVTLNLRAPSRGFQTTVNIPVVLPEFLRPFECSLQMFADLWASFQHQSQMVIPCVQQDIVMTVHLLASRCPLHVVRISGQECILSGQVLDFENSQVLLHVKITNSQTESLHHLWMKSCDRLIIDRLMPAIIILLSD